METGSYQTDPEADNAAAASGLSANNITTVLIRVMERIVVKQHSIITQSLTQLIWCPERTSEQEYRKHQNRSLI